MFGRFAARAAVNAAANAAVGAAVVAAETGAVGMAGGIHQQRFSEFLISVRSQPGDDSKLRVVASIPTIMQMLTCAEVATLLHEFSVPAFKISALQSVWPIVTDKYNSETIAAIFIMPGPKGQARAIMATPTVAPVVPIVPVVPTPGYPAPGYPAPGYPAPGYPAPGYPAPGYPAPGYPAPGYVDPHAIGMGAAIGMSAAAAHAGMGAAAHAGMGAVVHDNRFENLLAEVEGATFGSDKLKIVQTIPSRLNVLTCAEVARLLDAFSFGSEKINVLKIVSPKIIDKASNSACITCKFTFSSEKSQASTILMG